MAQCSTYTFRRDPRPFFKFAREIYPGQFSPSPCHKFIAALESGKKLLRNYTQNIDTLEQEAGISKVEESSWKSFVLLKLFFQRWCNATAASRPPLALIANSKCPPTPSEKTSLNGESLSVPAAKILAKENLKKLLCLLNLLLPPLILQYLAKLLPPQQGWLGGKVKVTLKYLKHLQLVQQIVKNQVHQVMCLRKLL